MINDPIVLTFEFPANMPEALAPEALLQITRRMEALVAAVARPYGTLEFTLELVASPHRGSIHIFLKPRIHIEKLDVKIIHQHVGKEKKAAIDRLLKWAGLFGLIATIAFGDSGLFRGVGEL